MSYLNSYSGLLYGGAGFGSTAQVVTDSVPAPAVDPLAIEQKPLARQSMSIGPWSGGYGYGQDFCCVSSESRLRGFEPCPIFDASLVWRMRADETINLAFTVVTGPILAGNRSIECTNDRGKPDEAERIRKNMELDLLPVLNRAMPGALECLHFGSWLQENVWGRKDDRTVPIDMRPILPLEAVLHQDNGRRFTGYSIGSERRDTRYAFLAVNQPHIDAVRGYSRNRNALKSWWRKQQSNENADRVERKASGIQMKIGVAMGDNFYTMDANGNRKDILPRDMVQKIADHAASGDVFMVPLTPFSKEAIQQNPALADIEAVKVQEFDWGDNGPALLAHLQRLDMCDRNMMRAWCRPEREAMEGVHGTKAEAGTHGQVGVTDSELVHSSICEQWDEQVSATYLRTNEDPAWVGCFRTKPAPLSDPQQAFLQKAYLALVADPATGPDMIADVDTRGLGDRIELPLRSEEDAKKKRDEMAQVAQQKQQDAVKQMNGNGVNGKALDPRVGKAVLNVMKRGQNRLAR